MSLNLVQMTKKNWYCWALMPPFLKAITEFAAEHTAGGTDLCAERFETCFGAGFPDMFGIAIVDDEKPGELCGHVICGVEEYLGAKACMVYQFNKVAGTSADWVNLNKSIQAQIDQWCHSLGLTEIMAMAESESRGRLFKAFGYVPGPVLMRRRFE